VAAFEHELARRVGVPHAVAVSSGTAALHLALLALEVGPGDLVVTTTYSWPATANVIELCGARPIFVDIDPHTFNMDPGRLAETLRDLSSSPAQARRVRAVLPVHAFGQPADMTGILACASRYDIPVVEDAACALGARWDGRPAGSWGRLGCFSFHPRKTLTTGEGGAVTTADAGLARKLRALRNHGLDPDAPSPDFVMPGFNYRLTEFQAALGVTQLAKLDEMLARRRSLAACYTALLTGTPLTTSAVHPHADPAYQSYVLRLPTEAAAQRGELIQRLKNGGVETTLGTWHIPLITYYRQRYGYQPGDFPVTDQVFQSSLTVPLHHTLQEHDVRLVVERVLAEVDHFGVRSAAA
jgi:dTDP-4-amino-4,6-dideoxygalactose transaminase